jgi:hypothetical protein
MSDPEAYPVIRRALLSHGILLSNSPITATFQLSNKSSRRFPGGKASVRLAGPAYSAGKNDGWEVPPIEGGQSHSLVTGAFYALRDGVHWISLTIRPATEEPMELDGGAGPSPDFSRPISIANFEFGLLLEYLARIPDTPIDRLPGMTSGEDR